MVEFFFATFCHSIFTSAREAFLYGFGFYKQEIGSKCNENGVELELDWN